MTDDKEIIAIGATRIAIFSSFHFLTGTMNVFANLLRGMGKNLSTMIISLICTCVFRIVWLKTIYVLFPSLELLYAVYPISWGLCAICFIILAIPSLKKLEKKHKVENLQSL